MVLVGYLDGQKFSVGDELIDESGDKYYVTKINLDKKDNVYKINLISSDLTTSDMLVDWPASDYKLTGKNSKYMYKLLKELEELEKETK